MNIKACAMYNEINIFSQNTYLILKRKIKCNVKEYS